MTVIQSQSKTFTKTIMAFFAIFVVAGTAYVIEYNSLVDLRHESRELGNRIVELQTENAELKNRYYELTDPAELERLAYEYNLVLEERPTYLRYAP